MTLRTSLMVAGALLAASIPIGAAGAVSLPGPISGALQAITALPQLKLLAPAPAAQTVQFDVVLPLRNTAALDTLLAAQQDPTSPFYHRWLSAADFSAQFGPGTAILNVVAAQLRMLGFQAIPRSRSVHVSGTAAQVNQAFGTTLQTAADVFGQQRVVSATSLRWPGTLGMLGAVIPAFNPTVFTPRPSARRGAAGYARRGAAGYARRGAAGYGSSGSLSVPPPGLFYSDLKQAYDFPSYQNQAGTAAGAPRLDGTGTTVAVVMSSDVQDSDVSALFDAVGFRATTGAATDPAVFARVAVNGGDGGYSADNPAAEEATLDVEQVLGAAPGTKLDLYVTPDLSDQSLISALNQIDTDDVADVVSLSFGQCELYYTSAYNNGVDQTGMLRTYSELFKQGNAEGITFVAASGDGAGLGCLSPSYFNGQGGSFVAGVSVPAADPGVTAVGGTNLVDAAASGGGAPYASENAWSDPELAEDPYGVGSAVTGGLFGAGGGVSTLFAQPSWQAAAQTGSTTWRTVPDIGMHVGGCPSDAQAPCNGGTSAQDGAGNTDRSMLNIVWGGDWDGVVGTSAAAPQFAGVVAMLVETSGRQGNLNPMIYGLAQQQQAGNVGVFHQGVPGFNGVAANAGPYSFTTGVGTLDVAQFLGLGTAPKAGTPGTPSNP